VPESRPRNKPRYTPPPSAGSTAKSSKRRGKLSAGGRWVAPVMCACWILGLLWIVTFYIAGDRIGVLIALGNWNLLIGMGLIIIGFFFATRWE